MTAVGDAAIEAAKLALKMGSAAADVALMAELGEELPLLQPALATLALIRQKVETVQSIPEDSAALHEWCTYLTACVIVSLSSAGVSPRKQTLRRSTRA